MKAKKNWLNLFLPIENHGFEFDFGNKCKVTAKVDDEDLSIKQILFEEKNVVAFSLRKNLLIFSDWNVFGIQLNEIILY